MLVVDGAAVVVAAGRISSTSVAAAESATAVLVATVVVVLATVVAEVVVLTVVVVVLVRSEMSGGMVGRKLKGCWPLAGLRAVLIREGPLRPGTFGLYWRPGSSGGGVRS